MKSFFKFFTLDNSYSCQYIDFFVHSIPCTEFSGIERVFYHFLEYCDFLGIVVKKDYLTAWIKTDLKVVVKKNNIHIDSITTSFNYSEIAAFEQAVSIISSIVLDTYDNWVSIDINDKSFKVIMYEFYQERVKERIVDIYMQGYTDLNQGGSPIETSMNSIDKLDLVRNIYNTNSLLKLDFIREDEDTNSGVKVQDKARFISKTGLPAIDNDYGGVFSKALITLAGPPGSGKTRFVCSKYVYPALVYHKVGVRFDELELNSYEIRNMLLSIHIANIYSIKIPDVLINRDDLSDEQRRIVESAKIDLFESNKYGRLDLRTDPVIVETLEEDMYRYCRFNKDIQIWCVDYTGLISSKPLQKYDVKNKAQIIDEAIFKGKNIAKNTDIATIFVNQYNKEGNFTALKGGKITVGMIEGGQAVQKHSDYDLSITFTEEQEIAGIQMLSTTKNRASAGFSNVILSVDKSISRWTQIKYEDKS